MSTYIDSILKAALLFPILALLLTLPYMIYNYRKYGAVSPLRSVILFSFLFYLMCAYALIIFPLPDPAKVATMVGQPPQWFPFEFVRSFIHNSPFVLSDPSTYLPTLQSSEFLEPVFNLLLTVPFGVFLAYYFRENLWKTVLFSFLLSLFFELTQLTGLYGIYPKPYRFFATDDLLLNTLGGFIGFYLGKGVRRVLPSKRRMDESSLQKSRKPGYMRRAIADLIDAVIIMTLTSVLGTLFGQQRWLFPAVFLLYFVGLESAMRGYSIGKALVRIRVIRTVTRLPLPVCLLVRYAAMLASILIMEQATRMATGIFETLLSKVAFFAALPGIPLLYAISWAAGFFKGKRLWYEALSGTELKSTFIEEKRMERV